MRRSCAKMSSGLYGRPYDLRMVRPLDYFSKRLRKDGEKPQRWPFRVRLIVVVISLLILFVSFLVPPGIWYYIRLLFQSGTHR